MYSLLAQLASSSKPVSIICPLALSHFAQLITIFPEVRKCCCSFARSLLTVSMCSLYWKRTALIKLERKDEGKKNLLAIAHRKEFFYVNHSFLFRCTNTQDFEPEWNAAFSQLFLSFPLFYTDFFKKKQKRIIKQQKTNRNEKEFLRAHFFLLLSTKKSSRRKHK